ncbi:MAG: hypothetical protein QOJ81_238 [Chloroflexota bacterium]|nr:hypothetical protein [Chloroflexota bacterium]
MAYVVVAATGCYERPAPNSTRLSFPVTNMSAQAATLEILNPVTGAPVGRVTPGVIPPNGRMVVVLEVPLTPGWVVFVNKGRPTGGATFGGNELAACGGELNVEIFVDRRGAPSWGVPSSGAPQADWCGAP